METNRPTGQASGAGLMCAGAVQLADAKWLAGRLKSAKLKKNVARPERRSFECYLVFIAVCVIVVLLFFIIIISLKFLCIFEEAHNECATV